jgi:hypothetical protein
MDGIDAKTSKKRTLSIQACNFCRRRHLKCDGLHPCVQCSKRQEKCIFEEVKKRSKKKQIQSSPQVIYTFRKTYLKSSPDSPIIRFPQIPWHHFAYIAAFAQSVQPLFPAFVPHTYRIVESPFVIHITQPKIFSIMADLSPDHQPWSADEICNAFEYAIVCSHGSHHLVHHYVKISTGSRLCKEPKSSIEFWKKAEMILEILIIYTSADSQLAERTLFLICVFSFFNIIHGNIDACVEILLKGYNIYSQHPSTISPVTSNRYFP